MPPISSTQRCSTASSQTTWSQPCVGGVGLGDERRGVVAGALGLAGAAGAARVYSVDSQTVTGLTPPVKYAPAGEAMSR